MTGIVIDIPTVLNQIGKGNVLAISGGRWYRNTLGDGVILPVRYGYTVEIILDPFDTYTVRRVFTRGDRRYVKGEITGVYAGQIGNVAYKASCYHDPMPF